MKITIFGVLVFILSISNLIKYKSKEESFVANFSLYCSVYIFFALGYFLKIGSFEFDVEEWLCMLLCLQAFGIRNEDSKSSMHSIILIFSIVIGAILLILIPYGNPVYVSGSNEYVYMTQGAIDVAEINPQSIRFAIRVILHIMLLPAIKKSVSDEYLLDKMINGIIKGGTINFLYILFEFISKAVLHSTLYLEFQAMIFGQNAPLGTVVNRIGIPILTGLWSESTQLSAGIFVFALILVYSNRNQHRSILLLLSIIVMLLSGSFRGYMSALVIIVIWLLQNQSISNKILYFAAGILIIAICSTMIDLSYYSGRLNSTFGFLSGQEKTSASGSEYVRLKTIVDALKVFLDRPIFGLGIGTLWCFATIPAVLSNIGLIGLISYFNIIRNTVSYQNSSYLRINVLILIVVYFFTDTFSAIYNPALLVAMLLLGLQSIRRTRVEENNYATE